MVLLIWVCDRGGFGRLVGWYLVLWLFVCLGFGVVAAGCGLVACCEVISGQISALLLDVDSLGLLFGCL